MRYNKFTCLNLSQVLRSLWKEEECLPENMGRVSQVTEESAEREELLSIMYCPTLRTTEIIREDNAVFSHSVLK